MDFTDQAPHDEALALLKGKPAITRTVFDQLLPELRGRAFTVTGVEAASVLQRTRDAVAGIASGTTWPDAKKQIIAELDPYLGDGAANRAELLLRTHGFQAFQASNWKTAQTDPDTTHLQYLTMEDDRVRDSHAALDGLVLPKSDPFWQTHYPPWEWNCRCMTRTINVDQHDQELRRDVARNPEDRNIVTGPVLDQLRNGTLIRNGQRYDVNPPDASTYAFNPADLSLPLADLASRYDVEVWQGFIGWAKKQKLARNKTLWQWLS